jgi:hypothetical protein
MKNFLANQTKTSAADENIGPAQCSHVEAHIIDFFKDSQGKMVGKN